jgi:cell division protease FtsH
MTQPDDEARAFAADFRRFLSWVEATPAEGSGNEVLAALRQQLGETGMAAAVVSREWPGYDQVNLQVAVNAWSQAPDRSVEVVGLNLAAQNGPIDMAQLIYGDGPQVRRGAPALVDLPAGPVTTLGCWRLALLLVTDRRGHYAILFRGPIRHAQPEVVIEVAGLPAAAAQDVIAELAMLRSTLNVFRGQVLELTTGDGGAGLSFVDLPTTRREDVILPDSVLRRVDRHTIDISARRRALRATRQHLKRGLLLYGPPGTGKTHTARYVIGRMAGATVVMLAGNSLYRVSDAAHLARELQPAVVLLEDVDLVAEERGHGHASSPILFELLDAMDGAGPDADILFILTTNRPEVLERALAHRPGRVDVAIEVGLPQEEERLRLFRLYGRSVPLVLDEVDLDSIIERTSGVTASFIKELLRRSVIEALDAQGEPLQAVRAEHVHRALDDMMGSSQALTRTLLGGLQA